MPSNPLHHPKGRRVRLGKRSQHARLQSDDADFADGEVSQRELSEDGTLPSPELAAPLFSRLTFNWMKPLLALGNRRALEFDDLPDLASVDAAAPIQASFDAALPPYRRGSGGSAVSSRAMTIAFFRAFGRPFLFAALLKLVHDSFLFVGPQLLRHIIRFLQTPDAPLSEGLGYAALLLLSGMVQSVALRQYFFRCFRTGMRIRSAVVTMVYRKSLTVSPAARQALSTGKVTNLMSVDAQRMQDLTPYLQSIWFSFFQIIMCMYFLWEEVGASCLGGVTVLALMIPLSARISFKMRQLQQRMMKVKDKRIMLTNETLQGIKTVKMQAWESATRAKITATREEELRLFRRYLLARALLFMIQNTAPLLVAIATFATYTAKQPLDVSTAFVCLALFDILRSPLWQLPSVLNNIIEAQVSLDRLSAFMSAPDIKAVGQGGLLRGVEGGVRVRIRGGAFSWGNTAGDDSGGGGGGGGDGGKGVTADAARVPLSAAAAANAPTGGPQHALTGVDLEVREGELLAVVGHVGSGKSSLLAAVLGEIRVVAGDVAVAVSSIAYVAQTPFIMNATLRENVLFGRAFDDARYRRVLAACALLPDLAQLPAGDATEIGEKGINLSGGQKARVSLARAVYADAELYLIDDPLSAVDAHVASHIFTSLFGGDGGAEEGGGGSEEGMLAGKTVVLVTNAMQFLPSRRVTRVAVLRPPGGAMAASANVRAAADAANSAASARGALALDDDDDAVEISLDDGPPGGAGRGSASPLASAAGASSPSSLADVGTFAELQLRGGGAFRQLMDACGESTGSTGALADAIGASNAAVTVAATGLVQRRGSALLTGDEAEGAAASSSSSSSSSSSRGGGGSSGAGGDPRSHLDRRMDELSDSLCAAAAAKKYDAAADLAALLQAMVAEREDAAANADADPLAPKGGDDSADGAGAGSGAGGLMSVEERSYGDVAGRVYMQYARAMGGWVAPLSVVGGYLLGQLAVVSSRWWLSYWSEHGEGSSVEGGGEGGSQGFYLGVYAAFAIGQCACLFVQYATCMFFGLRAARSTFEAMLSRILRAPMSFFDTTPMGRIMNRFSKEVNTVDAQLPTTWNSYLSTLATVIGVIFAILAATPLFALALVPILSLYVLSQRFFIRTSRELKRLDSISRSPLYAHFSETLDGTATVRAYARLLRLTSAFSFFYLLITHSFTCCRCAPTRASPSSGAATRRASTATRPRTSSRSPPTAGWPSAWSWRAPASSSSRRCARCCSMAAPTPPSRAWPASRSPSR
jgi:ABC-type multidrug transport system fused ATPase/permease subunit